MYKQEQKKIELQQMVGKKNSSPVRKSVMAQKKTTQGKNFIQRSSSTYRRFVGQ